MNHIVSDKTSDKFDIFSDTCKTQTLFSLQDHIVEAWEKRVMYKNDGLYYCDGIDDDDL